MLSAPQLLAFPSSHMYISLTLGDWKTYSSSGGGMIPEPHSSPLQSNGTKRTGLKISFSQPNLRKAGQMNLKFPATGYEATPEKFSIYSKVYLRLFIRLLKLI